MLHMDIIENFWDDKNSRMGHTPRYEYSIPFCARHLF